MSNPTPEPVSKGTLYRCDTCGSVASMTDPFCRPTRKTHGLMRKIETEPVSEKRLAEIARWANNCDQGKYTQNDAVREAIQCFLCALSERDETIRGLRVELAAATSMLATVQAECVELQQQAARKVDACARCERRWNGLWDGQSKALSEARAQAARGVELERRVRDDKLPNLYRRIVPGMEVVGVDGTCGDLVAFQEVAYRDALLDGLPKGGE